VVAVDLRWRGNWAVRVRIQPIFLLSAIAIERIAADDSIFRLRGHDLLCFLLAVGDCCFFRIVAICSLHLRKCEERLGFEQMKLLKKNSCLRFPIAFFDFFDVFFYLVGYKQLFRTY